MPRCIRIALVVALVAWPLLSVGVFAQTPAGISSYDLPRESFDVVIPVLPGPVQTEGHLAVFYELHLTNFSAEPLVVQEIKVIDGKTHRTLIAFDGESLSDHLTVVGVASTDRDGAKTITPGGRAILFVEITKNSRSFPGSLLHDITYSGAGKSNATTLHVGAVSVPSDAPVVLGPPLAGGVWASVHSPAWPRGHRRVTYTLSGKVRIPGRYAIDWVGLDEDGRITRGDPDRPADAVGYDAPVLAGADGSIAAVRDGLAESSSISVNPRHNLGDGAGNYIAIKIMSGRYVFYEHLRPGSIKVRVGQRVHRGDMVGALGFTGDTTGPHLHLHVADTDDPLDGEGLPFVIDHYDELGRYPDIGELGRQKWQAGSASAQHKSMEWPGSNVVVRFGRLPL